MSKEEINQILDRFLAKKSAKNELDLLESWYNDQETPLSDNYSIEERIEDSMLVWNRLKPAERATKIKLWPRVAIAASILLALFCGTYLYLNQSKSVDQIVFSPLIKPGGKHAYLTLANGRKLTLDQIPAGELTEQSGMLVSKTADGTIVYRPDESAKTETGELAYHTLSTPKGGTYQLQLPDGSKVWLNSGSSLKFPVSFAQLRSRQVELTGEAYFEVAKDATHPFEVLSARQNIEVLGTHFNMNTYTDEPESKTTLLEGSVKVWLGIEKDKARVIRPGEQAITVKNATQVRLADAENVLDWKNDEFYFKDMDFKTAMRKIARWYDVEIIYEKNVDTSFEPGGWISRKSSIASVLKMMESTGLVHFKAEGRRIIVTR